MRYTLDLMLRPGAEMLEGRAKITVTLDAAAGDLVLDWRTIDRNADASSRVSDIRRAFSMAITACAAKFCNNAI